MALKKRYVDIRSNGAGVIGRVYEVSTMGEQKVTPFRGPTRAHMIKELKRKFPTATSVHFNRRGITHF